MSKKIEEKKKRLERVKARVKVLKFRKAELEARIKQDELKKARSIFYDKNEDFSFYANEGYWVNAKGEFVEISKMDDKYIMRCLNKLYAHRGVRDNSPQEIPLADIYIPVFKAELERRGYKV